MSPLHYMAIIFVWTLVAFIVTKITGGSAVPAFVAAGATAGVLSVWLFRWVAGLVA